MMSQSEESPKNAIVTGSSNGIGESIVKELAKLNYKLIVTGRNEADIKRVAEQCYHLSPSKLKPLEIKADLENEADVDRLFNESMNFFGDNKLHLLINNAGYSQLVPAFKVEECYTAFKKITSINLNAVVRLTLLAAKPLNETAIESGKSTSIVNISSVLGLRPSLIPFAYGTSKAALNMFTTCMAVELAPNIRVNGILPGPIETKIYERSGLNLDEMQKDFEIMVPLKRIGRVDEVTKAVIFLANSNDSSYITGSLLNVDGGVSIGVVQHPK